MSNLETPTQRIEVQSPDGVRIVGQSQGEGPGLALVYGAMMEQTGWSRLAAYLQPGRTLYTYDRRGRGESTDRANSDIQAEIDDLRVFAGSLRQPLDVFGHSSGALLVLHAAMQGMPARRLVLYEPPLASVREPKVPGDLPGRIRALVVAGDRDGGLEAFMRDGMWLSEADIDRVRASDRWGDQLRYVETAAYDVHIARTFVLEPARLATLEMPVLLLLGSASPAWMTESAEQFAAALPDARIEEIEGQGHNAQFSAPDLLAEKIRAFLE